MGRDDNGGAETIERFEQPQQAHRHVGIDVTRRFVGNEQLWPRNDCTRDGHALLFAARQRGRKGVRTLVEPDPAQHFAHEGKLNGKVGAAFTSTASQHGGQETTLFSVLTNLLHFGMTIVGLDYGYAGQMGVDEVKGGAPYGATTLADGNGSRQPSEADLGGARYLGERVARTAAKLIA